MEDDEALKLCISLSHFMGFLKEAVIITSRFLTQREGASEETFLCLDHLDPNSDLTFTLRLFI